jgi:hypothetical protein
MPRPSNKRMRQKRAPRPSCDSPPRTRGNSHEDAIAIAGSRGRAVSRFDRNLGRTRATASGPTPQTPDLLGIYPGMPAAAARAQLQKRSSTINVMTTNPPNGFSLNIPDPMIREVINVYLTLPPNDQTVWMIQRSQNFSPQNPMSQNALLTALREKYGKETLTNDRGGGGLYVYWIFDPNGKLLSSADMGLTGCIGTSFVNYVRNGPPPSPTRSNKAVSGHSLP